MKTGILGGTFDPVHFGHLRLAEEARINFGLDRVLFLPSKIPPHKTEKRITSSTERIKLLQLAIKDNVNFGIELHDTEINSPSYTVDTLDFLNKKYPDDELYFIIGMDLFKGLNTWKNYRKLFELSNFIVARRPPFKEIDFYSTASFVPPFYGDDINEFKINGEKEFLEHISGKRIYFFKSTLLDISSSEIRDFVKNGISVKYLIPDDVLKFITKKNLYKE